jgi:hypothetical protein
MNRSLAIHSVKSSAYQGFLHAQHRYAPYLVNNVGAENNRAIGFKYLQRAADQDECRVH